MALLFVSSSFNTSLSSTRGELLLLDYDSDRTTKVVRTSKSPVFDLEMQNVLPSN